MVAPATGVLEVVEALGGQEPARRHELGGGDDVSFLAGEIVDAGQSTVEQIERVSAEERPVHVKGSPATGPPISVRSRCRSIAVSVELPVEVLRRHFRGDHRLGGQPSLLLRCHRGGARGAGDHPDRRSREVGHDVLGHPSPGGAEVFLGHIPDVRGDDDVVERPERVVRR